MSKLIVLTGIPGSGKSTYAEEYARRHPKTSIVASDKLRRELFGRVDDFSHEDILWERFEKMIVDKSRRFDVVIADSSASTNARRLRWAKLFRPSFNEIELVFFDIPFALCLKRNEMREVKIPRADMLIMRETFEKLTEEVASAYDDVIAIKS